MSLDESTVMAAVDSLRRQSLVRSFQASGARVPKFQHLLADVESVSRAELAVLCVLLLRGPQTLGEIRSRAARLMPGESGDGLDVAVDALIARDPTPVVARLPRQPGQKEPRYAHLLSGPVSYDVADSPAVSTPAAPDRLAALEELTREMRLEITDLRAQLEAFRKQFE
jgi:uncharacterized protein YceH (UPF0502 family)